MKFDQLRLLTLLLFKPTYAYCSSNKDKDLFNINNEQPVAIPTEQSENLSVSSNNGDFGANYDDIDQDALNRSIQQLKKIEDFSIDKSHITDAEEEKTDIEINTTNINWNNNQRNNEPLLDIPVNPFYQEGVELNDRLQKLLSMQNDELRTYINENAGLLDNLTNQATRIVEVLSDQRLLIDNIQSDLAAFTTRHFELISTLTQHSSHSTWWTVAVGLAGLAVIGISLYFGYTWVSRVLATQYTRISDIAQMQNRAMSENQELYRLNREHTERLLQQANDNNRINALWRWGMTFTAFSAGLMGNNFWLHIFRKFR